jgi:chaperonin GroES
MKIRPMNSRVVVKPSEAKQKIAGGIFLPETAEEKLHEGEVIAVADDATDEVAVGDRVVFKEFGGTEVKVDNQDYILLTADDLLAKYEAADKIPE